MCTFGHLHLHSEYSTLDGMGKLEELILEAKRQGQTFMAVTDHGSTSGLWQAQELGDEHGMHIIHGSEFYYEREGDGENGHLLVLAKNDKGLENMFKMQEHASVYNFKRKPRINWDILVAHREGLIITTTCLGSPFNQFLIHGKYDDALQWARRAKNVFGEDFYVELQPNSIPEQHLANSGAIRIAKQLDVKLVATNDVHYTFESDCFPHEVMLALQMNKKMSDEKRFRFSASDFWLKSEEEMYETFEGLSKEIVDEAINSTAAIAAKCAARIRKGNYLPTYYNIPEGRTERELLVERTVSGAKRIGLSKNAPFMKEVQNEIDVIDRNGYSGYFLIVADYVGSARESGNIVGDGRGSGAGSKTAYLTGITKIPPHEFDLLFERFMADGRTPDFDVDFSDQDAVFEDLQKKYGMANVARIIAFGKMTPKAVIRKVFNVFEHPNSLIGDMTKLVPDLCETMQEAYEASPQLLEYRSKFKTEWDVIDRLEGVISHESQHAGGVIIYPNISSILPVKTKADDRTKRIVAWDKYMLEDLGHFKFDILGLETLPIIRRALESINASGTPLDLDTIDIEDAEVYDMLCKGDVSGVFQISAQASKVIEQQPRTFRDLIAINALIRPGVGDWHEYISRRKGKEWFKDPNRPWMHETFGTMTYQEQFLLDCHKLAGWDIAYADKKVRKAKDIRSDEELLKKFFEDGERNGHEASYLLDVWKEIEDAVDGGYSFNKSHSASYAMMTYQTAYLKAKYPLHFYASLMSSEKTDGDGQDEIAGYIAECKSRGIAILPPDINHSNDHFVATDDGIAYRITTIKHVGDAAIATIHQMRPIRSFDDFMERREKSSIKQNVLVNLIKAGCFDFNEPNRAALLWRADMGNRTKTQIKEEFQCPAYEWDDKVKATWEKDVLGMYLSIHPMEKYGFKPLSEFPDSTSALQGGEITEINVFLDRNKNEMARVTLNTLYGNVKVMIFSSSWARKGIRELITTGNVVMIRGKRSGNDMLLDSVEVLT